MKIQQIKIHTASDEFIEHYLDFQEQIHKAYYADDYQHSRKWRKQQSRVPPSKNRISINLFAFIKNKIVGQGNMSYSNRENNTNPEFVEFYIETHPMYTQQGVGKAILRQLIILAKEHNKTIVETWIRNTLAIAMQWVEKLSLKQVLIERENRLYVENINQQFINENLPRLQKKLNKYKLLTLNKEDYLHMMKDDNFAKQLADFYTEADNLIPRGDSQQEDIIITATDLRNSAERMHESKRDNYTLYLLDGEKIIAESSSGFAVDEELHVAETYLTAVRQAYQRQGIATYLKILVTKHYLDTYPNLRYIETWNADTNEGMLAINTKLGYKLTHEWYAFEGNIADITNSLTPNKLDMLHQ